jgi:hypothetical protein
VFGRQKHKQGLRTTCRYIHLYYPSMRIAALHAVHSTLCCGTARQLVSVADLSRVGVPCCRTLRKMLTAH